MPHPVLYQNESRTVLLLDIRSSIEHGQCTSRFLKACSALENPYPSTEPKGKKRDAAIAQLSFSEWYYHASLQSEINAALAEIGERWPSRPWGRERGVILPEQHGLLFDQTASRRTALTYPCESTDHPSAVAPVILSTTERRNRFPSQNSLHAIVVHNPRHHLALVETVDGGVFFIPPRATFLRSTLALGQQAFLACQKYTLLNTRFDLILMDPPWSNRSVRHAGIYRTFEDQMIDPFQQAVDIMRLSLDPKGVVAIWITNKASIRSTVLETLHALDYYLFQEWVWIKTTIHGVPVSQLDGIWRRPYEILLLFRSGPPCQTPGRRVIAAVPDFHSRKPCLKILLEELLPRNYNALELFARNLTAGWWSWGDEVLKYQHEGQWTT